MYKNYNYTKNLPWMEVFCILKKPLYEIGLLSKKQQITGTNHCLDENIVI